jgi:hypothetical protein
MVLALMMLDSHNRDSKLSTTIEHAGFVPGYNWLVSGTPIGYRRNTEPVRISLALCINAGKV